MNVRTMPTLKLNEDSKKPVSVAVGDTVIDLATAEGAVSSRELTSVADTIKEITDARKRASVKGAAIADLGPQPRQNVKFSGADYDIEIVSMKAIDRGVEVLARAWDANGQIGFGKDGTVDIERFRIFNPPVLVDDPNGDIIREWTDPEGNTRQRKLKEDPKQAILQSLTHTIKVKQQKHGPENIVSGKVGNTTSTFRPSTGTGSPIDGVISFFDFDGAAWSTIQGATDGTSAPVAGSNGEAGDLRADSITNEWDILSRSVFHFDTSALSGDTVDSATFSYYNYTANDNDFSGSIRVVTSSPASDDDLVVGDYDQFGTSAQANDIAISSMSPPAYVDHTLNATGEGNVNTGGLTRFGTRLVSDADNSEPTWSSGARDRVNIRMADNTGTSEDPKLVVEHTAASTDHPIDVSETPSISDTLTRQADYVDRTDDESVSLAEVLSRTWSTSPSLTETLSITETISALREILVTISESIGLTDTLTRAVEWTRTKSESISITDTLTTLRDITIELSESVGITELLTVAIDFGRTLTETLDITDTVATPLNWKRRDSVSTTWTPRTKPY